MTDRQPTSLKELFLERTFGSDETKHIKVTINEQVLFDSDLRSARAIRLLRWRRFCWATAFGVCLVRGIQQLLGLSIMQPNVHWYDWVTFVGLLVWAPIGCWLAIRELRIEAATRHQLEDHAFFMDDLVEEFAAYISPEEATELREAAIDYLAAADDPTRWDKPWWRIKNPVTRG